MIDIRGNTSKLVAACNALISRANATIVRPLSARASSSAPAGPSRREAILRRLQKEIRPVYTVEEWIGGGSMGDVFRAKHKAMGTDVAIKVLNPDLAGDAAQLERFLREARIGATLLHPNIVWVSDFRQKGDFAYLVMNYVAGKSLEALMTECPRWEPPHVFAVAAQVARALEAAHGANVIHRDLKPSNICVDPAGKVVVLDFGIAGLRNRSLAGRTMPGQMLGTPLYMSPEQARGDPADERSDLYSLGAIMYELLAGENPFAAPDAMAVIQRQLSFSPPPLRERRDDVPAPLARIVHKLLSKDPSKRHQSAAELHAELTEPADRPARRKRKAEGEPAPPSALAGLVTMDAVLHRSSKAEEPAGLSADEQAVLSLADGAHSVQQVLASTGLPAERAMAAISSLQAQDGVYVAIPGIVPAAEEPSPPPRQISQRLAWGLGIAAGMALALGYIALRGGGSKPVAPVATQAVQVDASPFATVTIRSQDGRVVAQEFTPLRISLKPGAYTLEFAYGDQKRVSTITVGMKSPDVIRADFWEKDRTRVLIGGYR